MISSKLTNGLIAVTLLGFSVAHPGEHHDHEAIERSVRQREVLARNTRRSLDRCTQNPDHRALMEAKPQKYRRDLATLQEFEAGELGHLCPFELV